MNRILLGTSLLITAGLCGQSAQATPLYTVGKNVISSPTQGATYTSYYPNYAAVPYSVSDQWVDVSWAAPSASISIGWSMTDMVTLPAIPVGYIGKKGVAGDQTNGATPVLTDKTGHFRRGVGNSTSESISGTLYIEGGVSGTFVSATTLMDANGNTQGGRRKLRRSPFEPIQQYKAVTLCSCLPFVILRRQALGRRYVMLKKSCAAALSLSLLFLLSAASRADEITSAMLKADARLQTHVTLRSPHILIGELLERLSEQSGVTLTADDESSVGGEAVTVSLHDVPLSDAMNALWSLFSYKHAEWDWRRYRVKGEDGKYTYTLARPNDARFLAERLQEQVQTDFEAQAQELFDALNMPPDQLKEAAKNNLLLSGLLDDGRVRPGMEILASLPPETLQNILRSHQGMEIPVASLSPEAQKALNASWDWEDSKGVGYHHPDGSFEPLPRLDHISIGVMTEPWNVAPGVGIDSGRGTGDYFGSGFMQEAWQKKMAALWVEPGDATDNPASARPLAAPKKSNPIGDTPHPLADYLLRFSDAAQVPLIARIPHPMNTVTPSDTLSQAPATRTVTAFLAQAQQGPLLMDHKWRGGVLLLTCQNWFVGQSEGARLPWAEVKRLRDAEVSGEGFLTLDNIAHAANVLNDAQMTALGEWFPVMANAAQWHEFLAFYDKTPEYHPHVLSAKGDDYQYPESLVNSQLGIDALRVTHPNLRLQIQQRQDVQSKPPMHHLMFVVRDDNGIHPLAGQGFGWAAHEYQARLQVSEKSDTAAPPGGRQSGTAK